MAEHGRQRHRCPLLPRPLVRVADAAGRDLHQNFPGLRGVELHIRDPEIRSGFFNDRRFYPHEKHLQNQGFFRVFCLCLLLYL
jgi:hypothetical protein